MKADLLFLLATATIGIDAFIPSLSPLIVRPSTVFKSRSHTSRLYMSTVVQEPKDISKVNGAEPIHCLPLDKISLSDLPKVGGKTASLGEMIQQLTPLGVDVPGGFGVSSSAYDAVLDRFELRERLALLLKDVDVTDLDDLADRGRQVRHMVMTAGLPREVEEQIYASYAEMCKDGMCSVAVRSSATAEDLPNASFAGQQASFLNVVGPSGVAQAVLECLASIFTDRAIAYRVHNGFDHMQVKGAVTVQMMVRSDLASSGVAFTLCPDTGFKDVVVLTGSYGLGESVVGGKVDPDEVQVFKPLIGRAEDPIIKRSIGRKQTQIVYTKDGSSQRVKTIETKETDKVKRCFSDEDAKVLAEWCVKIEEHYSKLHGHKCPMDIEWAKDGRTGKLYIVQARPETVRSRQAADNLKHTTVTHHGEAVLEGTAIGSDAAHGEVRVIDSVDEISTMNPGDILVADMTDPDWVPAIRIASAVVTNRGGRTCHAAIVSRELGVPCLVGTKDATEKLVTGKDYTLDCSKGSLGFVYDGAAEIERTEIALDDVPNTETEIKLILGDPDGALACASLPVKGVGLCRQEFVVANHIGIHPNACLNPELVSEKDRKIIEERAINDPSPRDFFVRKLSEGVATIAAAFYPNPIIVRLGDFKSNEYCRLIGGEGFEKKEENPMIGLRGASRYLHPDFKDAFKLECEALSYVRKNMKLDNVHLMVPFCRTPEEGKGVIKALADGGLVQGEDGLKIWCMCELPSNVLAIDEFSEIFDGFSIGSNDLTQLTLGCDRDSGELVDLFDEDNPAVKTAIKMAIEGAHRHGLPVGLCGQAPSDKPDFAAFLVENGIESISLTPDSVLAAIGVVADAERKMDAQNEIKDQLSKESAAAAKEAKKTKAAA